MRRLFSIDDRGCIGGKHLSVVVVIHEDIYSGGETTYDYQL